MGRFIRVCFGGRWRGRGSSGGGLGTVVLEFKRGGLDGGRIGSAVRVAEQLLQISNALIIEIREVAGSEQLSKEVIAHRHAGPQRSNRRILSWVSVRSGWCHVIRAPSWDPNDVPLLISTC